MHSKTGEYCIHQYGVLSLEGKWLNALVSAQVGKIVVLTLWELYLRRKEDFTSELSGDYDAYLEERRSTLTQRTFQYHKQQEVMGWNQSSRLGSSVRLLSKASSEYSYNMTDDDTHSSTKLTPYFAH